MTKPFIVDSHCHLNFPDFEGKVHYIIDRAKENGVMVMQTICTRMSEFQDILILAAQYDDVYASVGIHPHETGTESVSTAELVKKTEHPKVIGIGETGLDYYYENSPRESQKKSFRTHIAAARETGLPLIVHSRDADEDTIEILTNEMQKGSFKFLIHCFSSTEYLAEKSIELGGYISISGIVTFKRSDDLRKIVKELPLDRLLVETDAPFLAPMPHRGKTNEPAFTRHVAECLAEIKETSLEEVAEITTNNFFALFSKAKRPK